MGAPPHGRAPLPARHPPLPGMNGLSKAADAGALGQAVQDLAERTADLHAAEAANEALAHAREGRALAGALAALAAARGFDGWLVNIAAPAPGRGQRAANPADCAHEPAPWPGRPCAPERGARAGAPLPPSTCPGRPRPRPGEHAAGRANVQTSSEQGVHESVRGGPGRGNGHWALPRGPGRSGSPAAAGLPLPGQLPDPPRGEPRRGRRLQEALPPRPRRHGDTRRAGATPHGCARVGQN
jgi:hypothetical protein